MVLVKVEYMGELTCLAEHEPSGAVIETTAPLDNGGKGDKFSPTDLMAAALGTCIATIINLYANRKGLDFKGMRIEVKKVMTKSGQRRIESLNVEVWMPIYIPEDQWAGYETAAYTCPVHKSLHPDISAEIQLHWPAAPNTP